MVKKSQHRKRIPKYPKQYKNKVESKPYFTFEKIYDYFTYLL